jgi:hypothetical protein
LACWSSPPHCSPLAQARKAHPVPKDLPAQQVLPAQQALPALMA